MDTEGCKAENRENCTDYRARKLTADDIDVEKADDAAGAHIHKRRTCTIHDDKVCHSTTGMAEKVQELFDIKSAYNKAVDEYCGKVKEETDKPQRMSCTVPHQRCADGKA